MDNLHKIQMLILRELAFKPKSRFRDLNITGLENDHFSYHVRVLVKSGFVVKETSGYSLTKDGKAFVGRMDTDKKKIEKQPKVTMLIIPERTRNRVVEYLVQTRTKEPYFGYTGFMTGKVRFGETIVEAAARELKEEMGVEADFEHRYVLHEMVYDKEGEQLEDKFFNIVKC